MILKIFLPFFIFLFLSACARVAGSPAPTPTSLPTDVPTAVPTSSPEPTLTPAPSPTPSFDGSKYGTEELDVTYCTMGESVDEPVQKMDIYYPSSGGPWPVFLYVHGGSWMELDKAEGEGWRGLNDQGFLVVSLNYRLAPINKFPAMIEDLKCAVRYLRAHASDYNLDPDHFAALGASAGGHLVGLMGTSDESAGWDVGEYLDQSSRVQAVITMAGFFDFTQVIKTGVATPIYSAFGALPGTSSPKLVASSPVTYITPDDPPFLIFHGDRDNIAPPEQSVLMDEQLKAAGVSSTLVMVTGGDHGLQGPDASLSSAEIYQMIVDFLNVNLK